MSWPASLKQRRRQPEVMDQPGLDRERHFHALRSLERVNILSGTSRSFWLPIQALARETGNRPLRLLDIASGAGDVAIDLWSRAHRTGLPLQVHGCDLSPDALDYARQRAEERKASVRFFPFDVLKDTLPPDYDIITTSLFLHHLEEDHARKLLRSMGQAAGRLMLVNDLRRSLAGYLLALIATRLLTTSRVVHIDALLSVEAAFTIPEIRRLSAEAGLEGATVEGRWPWRYLLKWKPGAVGGTP